MKKKVITVIIVLCVIVASISLGIILVNIGFKEDKKEDQNTNNSVIQEENNNINSNDDERKKVVLDSKIGNEVLSKLLFPNMYSEKLYSELDKNGISNDFKIMYMFSIISTYQEYSHYLREGEDYIGNYITEDDLEKVAKTFFADTTDLKHKAVFGENNTYNKEKENYVIVAKGYVGNDMEYVVEIPYEIYEYNDKIEVKSYRLYIKRTGELEDEMAMPKDKVYYDKGLLKNAVEINDERMFDETRGTTRCIKI